MKRIVSIALVIGLVMAMVPFASAQGGPAVTGKGGEDRALGIQLYGSLDLQMRLGDTGFNFGSQAQHSGMWMGSPKLDLYLSAALADKTSVLVQMQVPRVSGGNITGFGNGNAVEYGVSVHQAYVKVDQLITQDLSLTFGVQEVVFDVVGKGNPLVIALGRAEALNAVGVPPVIGGVKHEESETGGIRADYKLGDAGNITFAHMIVSDNANVMTNETVTLLDATYKVTDKTVAEGLFGLINVGGLAGSEVWIIGGGVASNGEFVPGLNIFGQVYFEFGNVGDNMFAGVNTTKAGGLMFDIGADYQLDMAWKPTFGAEYLLVTGDDTTGLNPNKKYEGFISYEDNNDLVVLEDKEFGFDVDQNYSVIKLRASIQGDLLASPVKDAFKLELLLGIAKSVEKMASATPGGTTKNLGTELDIKASWMASKQLKLYTGFGWLFGSDILDGAGVTAGFKKGMDSAFTLFVGTSVTF